MLGLVRDCRQDRHHDAGQSPSEAHRQRGRDARIVRKQLMRVGNDRRGGAIEDQTSQYQQRDRDVIVLIPDCEPQDQRECDERVERTARLRT